jgi:hypothetical protein
MEMAIAQAGPGGAINIAEGVLLSPEEDDFVRQSQRFADRLTAIHSANVKNGCKKYGTHRIDE